MCKKIGVRTPGTTKLWIRTSTIYQFDVRRTSGAKTDTLLLCNGHRSTMIRTSQYFLYTVRRTSLSRHFFSHNDKASIKVRNKGIYEWLNHKSSIYIKECFTSWKKVWSFCLRCLFIYLGWKMSDRFGTCYFWPETLNKKVWFVSSWFKPPGVRQVRTNWTKYFSPIWLFDSQ